MNTTRSRRTSLLKVALVAAAAVLAGCLLVLVGMEKPAEATFPGANGKIAFTARSAFGIDETIYVMNSDGSVKTNLGFPGNSPSWSPDGTKIAYEGRCGTNINRHICLANSDGSGTPTNISNSPTADSEPSWSPDGSKIVFARYTGDSGSGYRLYVMNSDGSNQDILTTGTSFSQLDPEWSPDGSKIVFSTELAIRTVDADGSNLHTITNVVNGNARNPSWSPDGTKIAYSQDFGSEIHVMNADGSHDSKVADGGGSPSWSPDGTKIAYSGPAGLSNIYVINADGTGTPNQLTNFANFGFAMQPSWSTHPDTLDTTPPVISGVPEDMNVTPTSSEGATLTYDAPTAEDLVDGSVPVNCSAPQRRLTNNGAADGEPDWGPLTEANPPALSRENGRIVFHSDWNPPENTNPEGDLEIFTMNPDGSAIKQLTSNGTSDSNPAFSPDGKSIVFSTNRDGNAEIYKMSADGSSQTRLTTNPASDFYPAFSPEGNSIIFATDRDGNAEIYKMSADGLGTPTNLTQHPAYDADTAVSSDGTIAFVSLRDGNFEIYTMNADGSEQRNRSNNPKWDSYPNFSPDGRQIAFHSNRDGNFEVYKMNSDGTGQVNLTNSSASERAPAFSPDGKKIAYESNRDGDGGPAEIYAMSADSSSSGSATFPLGTTRVSCGATDAAGNQATVSFQVTVEYAFGNSSGGSFGEPVRDTELNRLPAGASVPVKFGLGGDYGLNIFAEDYPKSRRIDCPELPTDVVEESSTLSKSGLTYDATSGLYTYVWKTDRAWRGTCRELNLKLADGSDHRVQFQFT